MSLDPQDVSHGAAAPQPRPAAGAGQRPRSSSGPPSLEDAIREGLSRKEATRLALGAAEALAARHVRGEVHGEVTPRCVLLARGGDVSLAVPETPEPTLYRMRYAAPEVAGQRPPTPASDVFALALIIRELLEGIPARRSTGDELLAEAIEGRVSAPHGLEGELQGLAVLATSPHPDLRPSASEFVAALRGAAKRRGLTKQEWLIAGIALVAVLMLVSMLRNSADERDRAGRQFEEAREAFKGFLAGIYPELDRIADVGPLAAAGERALASMEQMRDDERTPEDRLLFVQTLLWNGEAQRVLGNADVSEQLFSRALERSADLPEGPARSEIELRASVALGELAGAKKASFESLEFIERAIAQGDKALLEDPEDAGVRLAVGRAYLDLGRILATLDSPKVNEAVTALETARTIVKHPSLGERTRGREILEIRSEINLLTGRLADAAGYPARATALLRLHVAQSKRLLEMEPGSPRRLRAHASGAVELGAQMRRAGKYPESVAVCRAGVKTWLQLREAQPEDVTWQREWANAQRQLAVALAGVGDWREAISLHDEALALIEPLLDSGAIEASARVEVAAQLLDAADGLLAAGDLRRARNRLTRAKERLGDAAPEPRAEALWDRVSGRRRVLESELFLAEGSWEAAKWNAMSFMDEQQEMAADGRGTGLVLERARALLVVSAVSAMDGDKEFARTARERALVIAREIEREHAGSAEALSLQARANFLLGEDKRAAALIDRLDAVGYRGLELGAVRAATASYRR